MALYLAKRTSNPRDAPAAFLAKKLSGYAPSPINQLAIVGISKFPEVAHGMYRTHIDAFCYATIKKERIFAQSEAFSDVMLDTITLPFTPPPMVFSPAAKLSTDQANTLLKKIGGDASMKYIGKTLEYTIGQPLITNISRYISTANPNYATGPERLSPLGFKAFIKAVTLVEAFLATNYYPAFKSLDSEVPQIAEMTLSMAGKSDDKKREYFYNFKEGLKRGSDEVQESNAVLKRRKLGADREEEEIMAVDEEEIMPATSIGIMAFTQAGLNSSVITAKPSGRPSSINFGAPGACPNLPGILFPYFKGMNRPDFTTLKENFVNHFFRLFGNTFSACKDNISEIKRGLNNLSNTETGMEMTHLTKGIELALKTQTRLFAIFDQGYRGFVLLGGHFAIHDGTSWNEPVSAEELKDALTAMDTHKHAIQELSLMLSALKVKGQNAVVAVTVDELSSATAIMEKMSLRDFTDYDKSDAFDGALGRLLWQTPYTQLNPDTFMSFLDSSYHGDSYPSPETPMFIPSCKSPVEDRLFRWLATFGPDAPSLWNSRGDIISVLPDSTRKGKETTKELPPAPKEIIILPKSLLTAYRDWKHVEKQSAVSFNFKERAKEYRGHVIVNPEVRKKVWEKLQNGLSKLETREDDRPVKRARLDEAVVTNTDDLLKMW